MRDDAHGRVPERDDVDRERDGDQHAAWDGDIAHLEPAVSRREHHETELHGPKRTGRLKLVGGIVLVAAAAAAAYGIVSRNAHEKSLDTWTNDQALPVVAVAHPATGPATRTLTLPGDVQAFYEAPIYARVSGYLHTWYQDIGAHVKAGQVLATIDTPDLDQEAAQVQADLNSAKANLALAELTAKRWHALLASNSVSQQSADEKEGNAAAQRATVNAAQAHVDRLAALESFKRLTAPFAGIVTVRNTDVGALIGAGADAAKPLFKVADMHEMRVYVRVPQSYASQLAVGMKAKLTEPQYPGVTFPATLATTSQSVAADSRTVLVELMAPNPGEKLWAGTYAEVEFNLPDNAAILRVPASALIFRSQGAQLATITPDHHIKMKDVTVGRNLGTEIEITNGISARDKVVTAPPDTLEDGELVDVTGGQPPPPTPHAQQDQ
jgi:RND family efflux transporter MFP subunit